MALTTYSEVRPLAEAIQKVVKSRQMPLWFADRSYGEFSNDPQLTDPEVRVIDAWVNAGAPSGKLPRQRFTWDLAEHQEISADLVVTAPKPIPVPANTNDRPYLVYALPFTHDRWVRAVEFRPSDRSLVHHAILYVREQKSGWLRKAVPGVPYVPTEADNDLKEAQNGASKADILAIFTPGSSAVTWPQGMAKKLAAGADLVLQIHYVSRDVAASDQPKIALAMLPEPPALQILTVQIGSDGPQLRNGGQKISVSRSLPVDAMLVSLFPHTHLRGIEIGFDLIGADGTVEKVLKVQPSKFDWQSNYALKVPRLIRQGTALRWTASADDTNQSNRVGEQQGRSAEFWQQSFIGFCDIAVKVTTGTQTYSPR